MKISKAIFRPEAVRHQQHRGRSKMSTRLREAASAKPGPARPQLFLRAARTGST